MIGKLEELTLLAVTRTGPEALPSVVYGRFRHAGGNTAFSAVYTTLGRLTAKGMLVESVVTDDNGRERRAFSINGVGSAALREAISATVEVGGFSFGGAHVLA